MIRVSRSNDKLWHESVVDGPGMRLVIFLSGCSHDCPGCHNEWLQDPSSGENVPIKEIVSELRSVYRPGWHDGITISGGDPFFQSNELQSLLLSIRHAFPEIDVWVYSGYLYEQLMDDPALSHCDVLVDGRFEAARANEGQRFRGSGNQRIIQVSERQSLMM